MKFPSKASNKREYKLDPMRDALNVLAQRANMMARRLFESGVNSYALQDAYMSLSSKNKKEFDSSRENIDEIPDLFRTDDKKRFRELRREAARIDKFLSSASADVKVATYEEAAMSAYQKHGLSFHNQSDNKTVDDNVRFRGWDQNKIKFAMSIYRKIEEEGAAAIYGNAGKGGFGSDNLLNLIYDEIEGYNPNMPKSIQERFEESAIEKGRAALNEFRHNEMFGFLEGAPKSRKRERNILSEFAKSETADKFIKRNKWLSKW